MPYDAGGPPVWAVQYRRNIGDPLRSMVFHYSWPPDPLLFGTALCGYSSDNIKSVSPTNLPKGGLVYSTEGSWGVLQRLPHYIHTWSHIQSVGRACQEEEKKRPRMCTATCDWPSTGDFVFYWPSYRRVMRGCTSACIHVYFS